MSDNAPTSSSNLPQRLEPTSLAAVRPQLPPPPEEAEDRISLQEILGILRRRRWLIASVALALVVIVAIQVFTTTPLYESGATVQIDPEQPKLQLYEEVSSFASKDSEEYLFTQARNLQTRSLAQRVIRRLDLADNPAFMEVARSGFFTDRLRDVVDLARRVFIGAPEGPGTGVNKFLQNLTVQMENNTRLLHVAFRAPDANLAAEVANTTVDEFISQSFEVRFESTQRASSFLEERLEELRVKVEESEARVLRYARDNDIVNLSEKETVNQKRLEDLNEQLTLVEGDLIEKTARFELVRNATVDSFPESLETSQISGLKLRIAELEGKLASLSASYGSSWPAVQQHRTELAELKAQLDALKLEAIANAKAEYRTALGHQEQLEKAVDEQRSLVEMLDESSIQYNLQRREVDTNKQLYEGLLERLKETAVATGLKASNIRLVDAAVPVPKPASPRKAQALILATLLGLFIGTVAAFLLEAFDKTLKTPDDVTQYLRIPTVGVIPRIGGGKKGAGSWLPWRRPKSPQLEPMFVFGSDTPFSHGVAEAYRSLRTSLVLSSSDRPVQTIMVTSPLPSEGKTTTACNIASILAQTGNQTVIVDLDLRRSKVADVFDVPDDQGMSTFLSGNSDLNSQIRKSHDPRLFVLPAGPHAPNPAELVGSQRMQMGLKLLAEHFSYVVIDTPPASGVSDALALSRHVDGVLVVVRSGKTPIRATKMLTTSLMNAGARVLGVVINDAPVDSRDFDYYAGSYYYSHYYAQDEGV